MNTKTVQTLVACSASALLAMGVADAAQQKASAVPPPIRESLVPPPAYALDSSSPSGTEGLMRDNAGVATPGMNVYQRRPGERPPAAVSPEWYREMSRVSANDADGREAFFIPQPDDGFVADQARADYERAVRRAREEAPRDPPPPQPVQSVVRRVEVVREPSSWDYSLSLGYMGYGGYGSYGMGFGVPLYPGYHRRPGCTTSMALMYSNHGGLRPGFGLSCW